MSNISDSQLGPINPSVPDPSNVVLFSPYERKGVIIMTVAGIISCACVSVLLLFIIFSAISSRKQRPGSPTPFIRKQVAVFVVCLLASDLIQSISGILQTKWAMEGRIYESDACTVQAATLVMGDLGSTIWSCVIAAHTFSGLALGRQWPRLSVYAIVIIGWSFVIIMTAIGPTLLETSNNGPFFGIAGDWCFITSRYAIPRLIIHYIPLFLAAVIILVLYVLVFLVLRGTISFIPHHVQLYPAHLDDDFVRERILIAKRMLWYPVAYLTCIFPIATIRLVGLKEKNIPDSVWIFGMFFLFLLGAVDSVIYATTRTLIKPTKFSMLLYRSGSTASTVRTDRSSRKSESGDIGRADIHRVLGPPPQYGQWDKVRSLQNLSGPSHVQPGMNGIHVSFERIREVI